MGESAGVGGFIPVFWGAELGMGKVLGASTKVVKPGVPTPCARTHVCMATHQHGCACVHG